MKTVEILENQIEQLTQAQSRLLKAEGGDNIESALQVTARIIECVHLLECIQGRERQNDALGTLQQ